MAKTFIILTIGILSLLGCGHKSILTPPETELVTKLNFDEGLMSGLKEMTQSELRQLPAIYPETGEVMKDKFYDGILSTTSEENAIEYVMKLKSKFRTKGYLIFVFEDGENKHHVAVIKGNDDIEILKYSGTQAGNYSLENRDIIKKISDWKSNYGLIVIGCSRDWLHIQFDKLPTDMDAFANEVYEFCPDAVDQGVGSIDELKKAITEMQGLWLWWD